MKWREEITSQHNLHKKDVKAKIERKREKP